MPGYLLTWNPSYGAPETADWDDRVAQIDLDPDLTDWDTGARRTEIVEGDVLYLLRQGDEPRGIVARGRALGEIGQLPHWRQEEDRAANMVPVAWEEAVPSADPLPTVELLEQVPSVPWNSLYRSGVKISDPDVALIDSLWDRHRLGRSGRRSGEGAGQGSGRPHGPGRVADARIRLAVEERSLIVAVEHLGDQGWTTIERLGKPYDLACSDAAGNELHVEVKGTQREGAVVELTRNELLHARSCPTPTALAVVSDIVVAGAPDEPVASGGHLHFHENWTPDEADLSASRYDYRVPS